MYKLFPSMKASMTKKDAGDEREPRLQQVLWENLDGYVDDDGKDDNDGDADGDDDDIDD